MSGGHFNYQQYHCDNMADDIEKLVRANDSTATDQWGYKIGYGFKPETITRFKEAVATLRRAGAMAQRVDWLVCGDDGEDNFHKRWEKEVPK